MNFLSPSRYVATTAELRPRSIQLGRPFKMTSRTRLKRKEIDDVLGGDEMWKHADQTQGKHERVWDGYNQRSLTPLLPTASCDKCNFNAAYFYQLQIRSADEPMTTCQFSCLQLSVHRYLTFYAFVCSLPVSTVHGDFIVLLTHRFTAVASNVPTNGVKTEKHIQTIRCDLILSPSTITYGALEIRMRNTPSS
jgi:DNA-directed RNA polymerase subunit M/transcription elongation factor TFIIS